MTDLKQATIDSILTENNFDMCDFGALERLVKPVNKCGTACCIAGHIVAAATKIGMELPLVPLREDEVIVDPSSYQDWRAKGLAYDYHRTARAARIAWAKTYGILEANRLEFDCEWPCDLESVTADDAVRHINGEDPADIKGEQ